MSLHHYQLYIDQVFDLSETLVIKSVHTALRINQYLQAVHGPHLVQPDQPETWKYYLNISGQYHSTDPMMKVVSLDTLQEIDFTKENLQRHPATYQAYQYNSRYYRELLLRYPDQELLIQGILYPVDIHTAIEARDFTVLGYPKHLVEDNETSLIASINDWLYKYDERWNNKPFTLVDELYGTTVLAIMYSQLPALILNLRLKACKTHEAHSFHVRQYLASHGMLDAYLSEMTKEQALFFYRNIAYIERHAGKQEVFDWLVDKVMTDRQLPLVEYKMHHQTQQMPQSIKPQVVFRKHMLNHPARSQHQLRDYSLPELLKKEQPLTPQNQAYIQAHQNQIESLMQGSISSQLATKVLESSIVNYEDAFPIDLYQVYLNEWIRFTRSPVAEQHYVRIQSPKTGKELVLNVKDAYYYYLYAFARTAGVNLTYLPYLFAQRVRRNPIADVQDLQSVVDPHVVSEAMIHKVLQYHTAGPDIQSLSDYRQYCQHVHQQANEQLHLVYQMESISQRGMLYNLVSRLYEDVRYPAPEPAQAYIHWLKDKELEYERLSIQDWKQITQDLYTQVTGLSIDSHESLIKMQKAMVALLTQLSSYSIQILSDTQAAKIQTPYLQALRIEQIRSSTQAYENILLGIFKLFDSKVKTKHQQQLDLDYLLYHFWIRTPVSKAKEIDIGIKPYRFKPVQSKLSAMDLGILRLNQDNLPLAQTFDPSKHPNYQAYYDLLPEDKAKIKHVYGFCPQTYIEPTQADIQDLLLYPTVPGLQYQDVPKKHLNLFQYQYIPSSAHHFNLKGAEVTLKGFHFFHGNEDMPGFQLHTGQEKVDTFQYFDDVPIEQELSQFKYSGGWEYVPVFEPGKQGDEIHELKNIHTEYTTLQLPKYPIWSVKTTLNGHFHTATQTQELPYEVTYHNADLPEIVSMYDQRTLDNHFHTATHLVSFSFKYAVSTIRLSPFHRVYYGYRDLSHVQTVHQTHRLSDLLYNQVTHFRKAPINILTRHVSLGSIKRIVDERRLVTPWLLKQYGHTRLKTTSVVSMRTLPKIKHDYHSAVLSNVQYTPGQGIHN